MAKNKTVRGNNVAHNKFAEHYAEFGIATQAYLFAYPNAAYSTASTNGNNLLQKTEIQEKIKASKEALATASMRSKERTIKDLLDTAEQAKKDGKWTAYAKLHEMIIKMLGYYELDNNQKAALPTDIKVNIVKKDKGNNEQLND